MKKAVLCALLCLALLPGCASDPALWPWLAPPSSAPSFSLDDLPEYSGESAVVLQDNIPLFPEEDKTPAAFERYSPLDGLGRCGAAYANIGVETMPEQEREPIGMIRPTGWQTAKYDFVEGKYLYNRCHLIGYQLTGENANAENLITGTRYLNTVGMLPYEDQVADYVRRTENHVLYRATPIYRGQDLLCSGVELEGWSVEDEGAGVCFHVYVYNVQPGVVIDYATGENRAEEGVSETVPAEENAGAAPAETPAGESAAPTPEPANGPDYILNVKSNRFHLPTCPGVETMREKNRRDCFETREALIEQGYTPCGTCNP